MTKKTVDVIYSLEQGDGLPDILEVIDTEDTGYSLNRVKYWEKWYRGVHITLGVDFNKD